MFHKSKVQIPTKIPSKKNDGAPMILFIDVLVNNSFLNPILPIPLRVDKVTNGLSSSLIFPSKKISVKMDDVFFSYDFETLYSFTIQNLIYHSEKSYKAVCYRQLDSKMINEWMNATSQVEALIPTLSEDLDYILKSYLVSFIMFSDGMDEKESLKIYCEKMIDFFGVVRGVLDTLRSRTFDTQELIKELMLLWKQKQSCLMKKLL